MKKILAVVCIASIFLLASSVLAAPVSWTDWWNAENGINWIADGTIPLSDGTNVGVRYSGNIDFAQLGTGTNYWTEGTPAPYTGNAVVDNAPTASEMLALNISHPTNTITFIGGPVEDPLMAIVSMGREYLGVTYVFDTSFTVLSEGAGYWGDGTYIQHAGNAMTGYEFHGVVQFIGTVSSISWSTSPDEYWHGITVGLIDSAEVPEPSTLFILGIGLLGIAGLRRKM